MDRREFIRTSALAAAAAAYAPRILGSTAPRPIGLQLYTVRELAARDLSQALSAIAAVGYREVEVAELHGHRPAEFRKMVLDHGLSVGSVHRLPNADGEWEREINIVKELGAPFVATFLLTDYGNLTADEYRRAAATFNRVGERCKQAGVQFCYHNHNFEFAPVANTTGFDLLLRETDRALVKFELDCAWVTRAGKNPVQILRNDPERFPLLHIKDLKPGLPPHVKLSPDMVEGLTEVGRGSIDWRAVLAAARPAHIFVEQDVTNIPVLESIKISYDYVRKLTS